jgi:hypothetical protein
MLARSPVRGPRILARMKNSVIWLLKHNNSTVLSAVKAILEVEPLRLYDQNEVRFRDPACCRSFIFISNLRSCDSEETQFGRAQSTVRGRWRS